MRSFFTRKFLMAACLSSLLVSCKKQVEELDVTPLAEYLPLQAGKYITYRVDSTVLLPFGTGLKVNSYQIRHVIDAEITDALGRPSFRVNRFINDSSGSGQWVTNGTYLITRTDKEVELTENNLRFLKLHAPVREGFDWKGNLHLPDKPYASLGMTFSNGDYMKNWEYYYSTFASSEDIHGQTYTDVFTVEEEDMTQNYPFIPELFGFNFRSYEKYSREIGLVFRSTTMLETNPTVIPYDINGDGIIEEREEIYGQPTFSGFAIEMWMIDHN